MAWPQDAKLLRLEASLQQREEQIENHHAERISALRSRRSREVQQKLAYVHRYIQPEPGLHACTDACLSIFAFSRPGHMGVMLFYTP